MDDLEARLSRIGRQTPYRGHPVFVAQHAAATCCRTCLERWHAIPAGHTWTIPRRTMSSKRSAGGSSGSAHDASHRPARPGALCTRLTCQMSERKSPFHAIGINHQNAEQQAAARDPVLTRIEQFEMSPDANPNPNQERRQIVTDLAVQRNWLVKHAHPYRAPEAGAVQNELQRIQTVPAETERLKEEAQNALESIRTRVADTGAVSAASLYKERAIEEDNAAKNAARGVAATTNTT